MRLIKYSFLAAVAVILMVLALANSGKVTLTVLPESLASATGFSWAIELPLFVVIFGGILAGLLIGFIWEWFREHKHRAEAALRRSEVQKLESELKRLKGEKARDEGDEVLALLDEAS